MNKQDCFYLGKIVSKFSFKGEVLLKLDSDEIDFKKLKTIFLEIDGAIIPYSIDNIKLHKSSLLRIRFENIDNEEKAYWLGFIYADGYIRERKSGNSLEIKLSVKDISHLELFRKNLDSNHLIREAFSKVKYKGGVSISHMCHLAIYSSQIVESIKTKGVHSRKTFTIGKPNIDEDLIPHFIRGYFDGDGSFSFNPKNYSIKTQIVSASDEFKQFIIDELNKKNIKINLYSGIKLQIQNKMDNLKFYNYIYENAKIYLNRKKEKYEEFRRYYRYDN